MKQESRNFSRVRFKNDSYGFKFAKNNIMKSKTLGICMQCGKLTNFIEICSEGRLCSDECENAWYDRYNKSISNLE
jgi:hypothetical protein